MPHKDVSGSRSSTADSARQMAELIRRIPDDVVASFALANAEERVAQLTQITNRISYGMLPIVGWVERRRHPETADLLKRRLLVVLNKAVECAKYDIPEYAGGTIHECATRRNEQRPSEGAKRTATLVVSATTVANLLRGWADDIEAEDMQRDSNSGQAAGNTAQGDDEAEAESHDALPKSKRADSPSRLRARSAYDYAMERIPNAHAMTAPELFDAIKENGEAAAMLPPTAESFTRYLNDCGIRLKKGGPKAAGGSVVRRSDL